RDSVFRECAELASDLRLSLMTHVAETIDEQTLLEDHAGPFVSFLTELGVWDPEGLLTHPEEVCFMWHCLGVSDALYAHGNYLDPEWLKLWGGTIVYCPRTHAAFGHPPHPFREFLARGVRVALGTDSLASNPDLDVLAEARFIHARHPDVPG